MRQRKDQVRKGLGEGRRFRERRTGKTTDGLPVSRVEQFERVETRAEELSLPELLTKVRTAVEKLPTLASECFEGQYFELARRGRSHGAD